MDNWKLVLIIILILLVAYYFITLTSTKPKTESMCVSCSATGESHLLPLTDPAFNLREVAKQMILLEDHLSNKGKLCEQCIKKHSLAIEGYLEEALCLDDENDYCDEINIILQEFRDIEKDYINGKNPQQLSQQLRNIRKNLHVKYFKVSLV